METPADEDLERAFVRQEPGAIGALYARYFSTFHRAAFGVLRSSEDAEDCVHDVLFRLWRRPASYASQRGRLKAFVTVCIRNEAIGRLRRKRRVVLVEDAVLERTAQTDPEMPDYLARAQLNDAIAKLPAPQREALLLAYVHHLTHTEIARRCGEPIGTIKSRLSMAVRRLHGMLAEGRAS
jgi:RNA polymerase sigma-70 factor (ECF subfamily)